MPPRSQDDKENNPETVFTPGFKYELLNFLNGYNLSDNHLSQIEKSVDITLSREIDPIKQRITNDKHELLTMIKDESSKRKLQDEQFIQMLKSTKALFWAFFGISAVILGVIELIKK